MLRRPFLPTVYHQRLLDGERFVHIPDFKAIGSESDHETSRGLVELTAVRTQLLMPLRKDGALLGLISAGRREVRLFSETLPASIRVGTNANLEQDVDDVPERQVGGVRPVPAAPADVVADPIFGQTAQGVDPTRRRYPWGNA
jgi:hypothetical protein